MYQLHTGEIAGARFSIAVPGEWNGRLVLLAHGLRPETVPLRADLDPENQATLCLVVEGWMVAMTSYRRNGVIVMDALEDIDRLREHVAQTYGPPARVLVEGHSMGGAIGTIIAETRPDAYGGVLAVGAALWVQEPGRPYTYTHAPRIPLLFLSNRDEAAGPREYVCQAAQAPVPPTLWVVARDGHVNVNLAEIEAALRALDRGIDTGYIEVDRDATICPVACASSAIFEDDGAYGTVAKIGAIFGNVETDLMAADLEALGLAPGTRFHLTYADRTVDVCFGRAYDSVLPGEWVAFLTAEGNVQIARNFANAAQALGCYEGASIFVQAVAPHGPSQDKAQYGGEPND